MASPLQRESDRLARGGLIPLASLIATLPLLARGPSCGHDFDFHVTSWLEAAAQLAHGSYPYWAYTPAFNAGEPRFLFYPPLSWLLGALLGLLLPWLYVPAAFTFVALTLSGLTAHSLARRYTGSSAALLAAVVYLANPYMLFTAYERTAYGELLAAAWMPMLFAAALAQRVRVPALAVPVALLWLTNAPAGVMGCYALAVLLLVRLAFSLRAGGWRPTVKQYAPGVAGVLLGLALAGFYLVPAVAERALIQPEMALVTGMQIADSTLFHHMLPASADTAYHDQVVRSASLIACMLLAGVIAALAVPRRRRMIAGDCTAALVVLIAVIAFLLTPASLPVWAHLPELRFLQFSWRLCALLAPTLVLLFALTVPRGLELAPSRLLACVVLLTSVLAAPAWLSYRQTCSQPESLPTQVTQFNAQLGVEPTDEYTPVTADNDALKPHNPAWWLVPSGALDAQPTGAYATAGPGSAPRLLHLTLPQPALLVLNLRDYPLWRVTVNGYAAQAHEPERVDGLLTVALPAGADTVELSQHGSSAQTVGMLVSLLAALVVLAIFLRERA